MSKQILARRPPARLLHWLTERRYSLLTVLIFAGWSALVSGVGVQGLAKRAPQEAATTSTAARSAALTAATEEVLKETSDVRQLSIVRPVQSAVLSRAEIERAVIKNLDEQMSPADMHAAEVMLKKLGLAPPEFQYRALIVRLLTEQVAGYYEPKTRQFYLADWIDIEGQKPIMAHELTHALQDQHFNLQRFQHWPKGDSDAELAAHALIEGDATLAMAMYVEKDRLRALSFLKSLAATGVATDELEKAPRALRESLLFPYQEGIKWTRALHRQGGWDRVSQAYSSLPQSTEQILHPEKYLAHEAPVKVTLPDLTALLNKAVRARSKKILRDTSGAAWKKIFSDINGEWGFYLLLDQYLKMPAESRRAAAGWSGDSSAVYENANGAVCYISISVWDTESDAREFFDAYVKRVQIRYGDTQSGSSASGESPTLRRLQTSEGAVTIELRGNRVVVLEGIPDRFDEKSLARIVWN